MRKNPVITIVGGGFCGCNILIQLIKQSGIPIHIVLVNKEYPVSKGLAFSSYNSEHVLNVPAAKMSAVADDPDNFLDWIRSKPEYSKYSGEDLNGNFLPRNIYGHYLEDLFNTSIRNLPDNITLEIINDEVVDIIPFDSRSKVILKNNKSIEADRIVLALGNFNPDNLKINNKIFYDSKKYFQNPWQENAVEGISDKDNVLILGTGLTMVDIVLSLMNKPFTGKIYAISTKGFFPLSHKKREPYTDILKEIHPPYEILNLYNTFRKHIKTVLAKGITGEAVVDAIRPRTQEIWMSLSLNDKIRFMGHIRHLWGVARHRLPKEIFDMMQKKIQEGSLEIIGGRLQDLNEKNDSIYVTFKERKSQKNREVIVNRVINCTGPATDLEKIDQPLIRNLLSRGMITNDEMKLGLNALPDGTVIQKDNSLSPMLFAMGSMLKGILWETTAVPELRVQSKNLASELIRQLSLKKNVNV